MDNRLAVKGNNWQVAAMHNCITKFRKILDMGKQIETITQDRPTFATATISQQIPHQSRWKRHPRLLMACEMYMAFPPTSPGYAIRMNQAQPKWHESGRFATGNNRKSTIWVFYARFGWYESTNLGVLLLKIGWNALLLQGEELFGLDFARWLTLWR